MTASHGLFHLESQRIPSNSVLKIVHFLKTKIGLKVMIVLQFSCDSWLMGAPVLNIEPMRTRWLNNFVCSIRRFAIPMIDYDVELAVISRLLQWISRRNCWNNMWYSMGIDLLFSGVRKYTVSAHRIDRWIKRWSKLFITYSIAFPMTSNLYSRGRVRYVKQFFVLRIFHLSRDVINASIFHVSLSMESQHQRIESLETISQANWAFIGHAPLEKRSPPHAISQWYTG